MRLTRWFLLINIVCVAILANCFYLSGTDTVIRFYNKNKFVDMIDGETGNPKKALNIHGTPIHEVFLERVIS